MRARKPLKVATESGENLRGRRGWLFIDGRRIRVMVITHIRNDRWLVEGRLPERFKYGRTVVARDEISFGGAA